ncbi:GerMN domain-containing protein [Paenibacillus arenilitoris]|uniref:GerMN domain-containing protein n=1 Tax=Paenibacillus arenilitoris TaxID=2772299 RepID=A0A927CNE0_9BACL|nr:GerMN domain-containing protein [Paenibacillus arenilitoris]MBD2870492.1 GerMN domain-containing protein [Paenibacillus arenilitoris]
MVQKRWIRGAVLTGVLALPILTAGCSFFSQETGKSIDPPQVETEDGIEGGEVGQAGEQGQGQETQMTVYLEDRNGYLAPISLLTTLGEGEVAAQKALEMMVENGAYASQLPEDFRALIPQGTQIKSYSFDKEQKLAVVEFSEPFAGYNAQDERSIVEAITWTLTAIPGIEGVEIWYEGAKLAEMPVDAYPLDEALTRDIGINIETAEGVNYAQSTPVTLYFSGQTLSEEQYYVPVTRLVERSDSPAQAALEQLISGPLDTKELTSVILPDVEVTNIAQEGKVVTVDLKDETYQEGQKLPAEMLQALVLSVTENTPGAETVQIKVNGETNIVDINDKSYSEPVGRPHHVNAIKS